MDKNGFEVVTARDVINNRYDLNSSKTALSHSKDLNCHGVAGAQMYDNAVEQGYNIAFISSREYTVKVGSNSSAFFSLD